MLDDVVAAQISGRVLVPQHVAEHPLRSPGSGIADLLGKLPAVLAFRRAQQALQVQASLPSWLSPDEQLTQPHLQRTQLLTPGKDACRVCRHGSPPRSHPRDSWSHSPPNSTVELKSQGILTRIIRRRTPLATSSGSVPDHLMVEVARPDHPRCTFAKLMSRHD